MKTSSSIKACLLAAASLALIGVTGCDGNKPGPAETAGKKVDDTMEKIGNKVDQTAQQAREQTAKAGKAIDDTAITAAIKAGIIAEPGLKVLKIDVDTVNGAVTLTGSAESQEDVRKAAQIASSVQGVRSVDNRLAVSAKS